MKEFGALICVSSMQDKVAIIQVEEEAVLDLLDNDSQALLSKLVPERSQRNAVEKKQAVKAIVDLNEGRTLSNAVSGMRHAALRDFHDLRLCCNIVLVIACFQPHLLSHHRESCDCTKFCKQ